MTASGTNLGPGQPDAAGLTCQRDQAMDIASPVAAQQSPRPIEHAESPPIHTGLVSPIVHAAVSSMKPKDAIDTAVRPMEPTPTDIETGNTIFEQPSAWRPSVLRIGPLVGLAALAFAAAQIVASFAVLKASDGDAVAGWKYQPTVYLAILTAVSNKALSFAVVQGTVCEVDDWTLFEVHQCER
jgi:hypothetical protein